MRRFLFFPLLFVVCFCQGQKIRFTDADNRWLVKYTFHTPAPSFSNYMNLYYHYITDTIINGQNYKQLVDSAIMWSSQFIVYEKCCFIREDTIANKVYILLKDGIINTAGNSSSFLDTNELLLYDYNLKLGDTFNTVVYGSSAITYPFVVTNVDSVEINNYYHKRWHLADSATGYEFAIIEGIGSSGGIWYSIFHYVIEVNWELTCFFNPQILQWTIPPPSSLIQIPWICPINEIDRHPITTNSFRILGNPLQKSSLVLLPYRILSGTLTISDITGKIAYTNTFKGQKQIHIGNIPLPTGFYFLTVIDLESSKVFKEKLVVE
jgi:hypothetical protein